MEDKACTYCGNKVVKRQWEQKLKFSLCLPGIYDYYVCSMCGMRYEPQDIKDLEKCSG